MSRILRRPMFRGGRVDARGTGIASGLGYNNGGRVGYKDKGFVGGQLLADPGAAVGLDIFSKEYKPKDYRQKKAEYEKYEPEITSLGDIEKLYNKKLTDDEAYLSSLDIEGPLTPDPDRWDDWYDLAGEDGRTEFFHKKRDEQKKILDEAKKFGVTIDTELEDALAGEKLQEELELTPAQLENIELRKLLEEQMKPGTAEEEIEKNKKIFQKAYGSGRADDASSMLLNFAGKALKPEATVKSAFGEFFEEEGKRPSESKKYKDAATTAAINAYLTGQKDYDSMMKQMKLIQYGNRDKITVASEAANLKGKDWESALSIVQDRYRGTKKRDSFLIVSETLKGVFGKPVDQKKGELGEIQEEDLIEGFTILTTKAGKIILEKIDGVIKKRPDLVI